MGFFYPPPKRVVQPKFLDVPIKVLECVDIVFLGQFDVLEHVFNISLVIGSLLVAPMARQKHFRTQKMTIFGSFCVQTPEIWFPKTKFIR